MIGAAWVEYVGELRRAKRRQKFMAVLRREMDEASEMFRKMMAERTVGAGK